MTLSLVLHGVLLLGFVRPHLPAGGDPRPSSFAVFRVVNHSTSLQSDPAASPHEATAQVPAPVQPNTAPAQVDGRGDMVPAAAKLVTDAKPTVTPLTKELPPAPDYRAAGGLDPPPKIVEADEPVYPERAGNLEGTVKLRLLISSTGTVDNVAVVEGNPPGYFEASALAAFAKAKFSPGYFLGVAVKSQMVIEVGYSPINRGSAVSGQAR